jgi:hypothetical protein
MLSEPLIGQCIHCGGSLTADHVCPSKINLPERLRKPSYIGVPAVFKLEQACQQLNDAFGYFGCYLVGSANQRSDWRDIDVRFVLEDDEFDKLFPDVAGSQWEHDPRWLIMTVAISEWLSKLTGLPVDFQFQRQTNANELHKGERQALGIRFVSKRKYASNSDCHDT